MDKPITREQLQAKLDAKQKTKIVPLKSGGSVNVLVKGALWGIDLVEKVDELSKLAKGEMEGQERVSNGTIAKQFGLFRSVVSECILAPDGSPMYESDRDPILDDLELVTEQFSAVLSAIGLSKLIEEGDKEKN